MAENVFQKIKGRIVCNDVGIDLGTASVLVTVRGRGIVLREPSVAVVEKGTDKIVRVGYAALKMAGRTPENLEVVRPLREGVINKYQVSLKMVDYFIRRACGNSLIKPRVMICIPTGATEVEECAVIDAATGAGARQTYLIEEPVAAAIGAGLDISEPNGKMIVDIGGGTTDIAVLSLDEVVVSESIKIAGDKFDEAIMRYTRTKYNILIGETIAEQIKREIGAVYDHSPEIVKEYHGRNVRTGLPDVVRLSSREMLEALAEPITAVIDAVCSVIARTPPELVGDIMENGIVMTGGGSLLRGLDTLIGKITGIPARVAKHPIECVALGTAIRLENLEYLQEGAINLSAEREKRK